MLMRHAFEKRENKGKKQLKKERCEMIIFFGDHFKGLTHIRNFMFNYELVGFWLYRQVGEQRYVSFV